MARNCFVFALMYLLGCPIGAVAHSYEIDWCVIGGGAITTSSGGGLELGGTIGQPDGGPVPEMAAGPFHLTGGLWPAFTPVRAGDSNCDGAVNFDDINAFVLALIGGDAYHDQYPDCDWLNADCDGNGHVDFDDINSFVVLLSGGG